MVENKMIWIIVVFVILILLGASPFYGNKTLKGTCMVSKNNCKVGLYCAPYSLPIPPHGVQLPIGSCKLEFCPDSIGPSAEKGKRYVCNDGSYGCNIFEISTIQTLCNQFLTEEPYFLCDGGRMLGKCLTHFDTRARDKITGKFEGDPNNGICKFDEPLFIQNGECRYLQ